MMEEQWKDIEEFNGKYQVSNHGRIRSWKRRSCKIKVPHDNRLGYLRVQLWENNVGKHYYVHILVARAFVSNPDNKPEVDHIDRNRSNNMAYNLRWHTRSENVTHAHAGKVNNDIVYEDPDEDLEDPFGDNWRKKYWGYGLIL